MDISTTLTARPVDDARLAEILGDPGFGTHFTDHMVTVEWTPDNGWHDARLGPFAPLQLHGYDYGWTAKLNIIA